MSLNGIIIDGRVTMIEFTQEKSRGGEQNA